MNKKNARFGVAVSLPDKDPMAAAHLLGEQWQGTRWFDTEHERDRAYAQMLDQPSYYRQGDSPSIILTKVLRD